MAIFKAKKHTPKKPAVAEKPKEEAVKPAVPKKD